MNSPDEQTSTQDVPHIAAPFAGPAKESDLYSNPLWEVTLGLACLFALLAILVAAG